MKPYEYLLPTCCANAREHPCVFLADTENGTVYWFAPMHESIAMDMLPTHRPRASFCPYCGEALPKMRRRAVLPGKVCVITDGGYYCDTCGKRLNACKCLPPAAAWEPDVRS